MGFCSRVTWDVTRQIKNDKVIPTRVVKVSFINLLMFIILLLVKKKEIREVGYRSLAEVPTSHKTLEES